MRRTITIDLRGSDSPETVRQYVCSQCSRQFVWGEGAAWFPRNEKRPKYADPEPGYIVCSDECRKASPYSACPTVEY